MVTQAWKSRPRITGLLCVREQSYSFFIPNSWHKLQCADDSESVIYAPDPTDPYTIIAVNVAYMDTFVSPEGRDTLSDRYFESIQRLPGVIIDSCQANQAGDFTRLEVAYTFREGLETRQRWDRVFCQPGRQIVISAQAACPEKYAYWLPCFFEAMMTVKVYEQIPV